MCKAWKVVLLAALASLIASCGGGGGGSGSNASVTTDCVTSNVSGCTFSTSDPTQSAVGWWKGTRSMSIGTIDAYMLVNNQNSYWIWLADDFSQGLINGALQVIGSSLSTLSTQCGSYDTIAGGIAGCGVTFSGSTAGVVTNSILNIYSPGYVLYISSQTGADVYQPATLDFTYNSLGDQPLSYFTGNYTDPDAATATTLSISSSGSITYNYNGLVWNPNVGSYVTTACHDSFALPATTIMKNVKATLSAANNCGTTDTITFYAYKTSAGAMRIAVLGVLPIDSNYPHVLQ